MMTVEVNLELILAELAPGGGRRMTVTLPEGATVEDLIARLQIPADHTGMVLRDGQLIRGGAVLCDGDHIMLFPPLSGG
ncbi:MAG: MoaD/ThiS family protein [Bacillota bacterium]